MRPVIGILSLPQDTGSFLPAYGTYCHYIEQVRWAGGCTRSADYCMGSGRGG